MMKKPVILIGVGEVGGVFARGVLKIGYPVYPVTRGVNLEEVSREVPNPEAVVIGVGEKDLQSILETIPEIWQDKLVLLQNELLPRDWNKHNIANPTVISVWFEKKPGQDVKVIIPSPVYGPQADLIKSALNAINVSCDIISSEEELLLELVIKNVYILTVNIAGLEVGGNVRQLWNEHQELARNVASDVMDIQEWLTKEKLDRGRLIEGMVKAFEGDWEHKCMGRSAPARLERAIQQAAEAGLEVAVLTERFGKKES
ncbi:hypothetical protein MNBD_UNCLBAC01-682 [hydrothermal vent metagenome]|uniref:Ketopantoate reductase N-terminal domain-containing protein n=1 Tax=hydrothermal vent metagenome TaxID=652676 RepID=A0A3B1D805_9ZZZZ